MQVSITSQGQISIPARIREALGITIPSSAVVQVVDNKIVIEPVKDLTELKGALSKSAIQGKKMDGVIKMEKEALGKHIAEKHRRAK